MSANPSAQPAFPGASRTKVRRHLALESEVACPGCGQPVPLRTSQATGWSEAHACAAGRLHVHVELAAHRPWAWEFLQA
jgi:hypothetical protein